VPYITEEAREAVDKHGPGTVGELTYSLTEVVLNYLGASPAFGDYAEVLGALEATKLELYARSVRPYEDGKRRINGDLEYPR
jgi:hypothetical protein